jgi:GTP-binding protein
MSQNLPLVAIIGRTNAGKSSLFNRLIGRQDAIVAREAGTTRDAVYRTVDGKFLLVDTAGLKPAEDDFETSIQDQIDDAVAAADLILLVVDRTEYPDDTLRNISKKALKSKKPVFLILNKSDLREKLPREEFLRLGVRDIFEISAEHSQGIRDLYDKILHEIPRAKPGKDDEDVLKIALIGRPNVGKSNLFNTLAGKQQAIVAPIAGTTRDINRVKVKFKNRALELLDTAGMRRPGKREVGIEKFSVLRTVQAISEADICLLLIEATDLSVSLDQKLAGEIIDAGKGLILAVSKWDLSGEEFAAEETLATLAHNFDFAPWAPAIFTSSITGQNVTKIFEIATQIDAERHREIPTRKLNDCLQNAVAKHPPAGLKNTHPKFRYIVQTDVAPPWFVIYGAHFKFIHWSYKRYLERNFREVFGFAGTPIKFSFRDEKQIKANRENGISTSQDAK